MIHSIADYLYGAGWGIHFLFSNQDTREAFILGWVTAMTVAAFLTRMANRKP